MLTLEFRKNLKIAFKIVILHNYTLFFSPSPRWEQAPANYSEFTAKKIRQNLKKKEVYRSVVDQTDFKDFFKQHDKLLNFLFSNILYWSCHLFFIIPTLFLPPRTPKRAPAPSCTPPSRPSWRARAAPTWATAAWWPATATGRTPFSARSCSASPVIR